MRQALVLGGGGVVGVAWETGLIGGLLDNGIDLRAAEAIVGTSAGSMVGTRLAAGQDVRVERPAEPLPSLDGGPDLPTLEQVFRRWTTTTQVGAAFLMEIGALALSARTVDESSWIAATGGNLGVETWPHGQLRIISVDVEDGSLGVHDRASGAALDRAVASSCAIPGMFPPITINGRRYMDGGIRSGTSADVLLQDAPELVIVIAPICKASTRIGALAETCLDNEIAALEAGGARVVKILPLADEIAAFGPNLMDPARAELAAAAGRARAESLAFELRPLWRSALHLS
jgi:NTE family protein